MCLKEDPMAQILVVGYDKASVVPRGYLILEQALHEGVAVYLCALSRRER
jgi:hypothetical protein